MNLTIRGDKVKVTPAIKEYIETKMTKLDRYFEVPEEISASIIIRVRGLEQIVEVTVPTKKYTLRAEESHNDLYAGVDLVLDKLERQIRKNKTKLKKTKKSSEPIAEIFAYNAIDEEESPETKIVKRKEIETKPMDEEEAILQMELLNHDFFVFKNIDEECMSLVYKRKDGQYGIINIK